MSKPRDTRFELAAPVTIQPRNLTLLHLSKPEDASPHVDLADDGVIFCTEGWYEVLMDVHWDADNRDGTRFSHTKIPGQEPLHSEAINADVLAQLSGGRQLLRGNTMFGPDRMSGLALEVWQDSEWPVVIREAGLTVRELDVPRQQP